MRETWRETKMSREVALCVVCGAKQVIDDLIPVRLVGSGRGMLLSGVCGGCILDVDGAEVRRASDPLAKRVQVEIAGGTYDVVRR